MMYPVLAKVRYEELGRAKTDGVSDRRFFGVSLFLSWVIGPAVHVHARVALPRRPPRLSHRRDHRRPCALHRDGADLERPRQGRPRPGGGARRLQRALPGRRVLAARLLLLDRPARLARPRHAGLRGRHLGSRAHGADLPRHPAHRRIPHPPDRAEAQGTRLVRPPLPARGSARSPCTACCSRSWCCSRSRATPSPRNRRTSP